LIPGASPSDLYPASLPVGAAGQQTDIIGSYLTRLYGQGITAVCSAGNKGAFNSPLNDKTPRLHGGANTPLIVVGMADSNGNRDPRSQVIDPLNAGILSMYAIGVDVLSASFTGDDIFTIATGSSEATAQTAGMAAYFLANDLLQANFALNGLAQVGTNVKAYLRLIGTQMKGIARTDPVTGAVDSVPRLSNGETVPCTQQNGQIAMPIYTTATSPQTIDVGTISPLPVTEGTDIVLPLNLLVSSSPTAKVFLDILYLLLTILL
jgi:subtilisin family serine protease